MVICWRGSRMLWHDGVMSNMFMLSSYGYAVEVITVCSMVVLRAVEVTHACSITIWCCVEVVHVCSILMVWCWRGACLVNHDTIMMEQPWYTWSSHTRDGTTMNTVTIAPYHDGTHMTHVNITHSLRDIHAPLQHHIITMEQPWTTPTSHHHDGTIMNHINIIS